MASSVESLVEEAYRGPHNKGWICDRCGEEIKTAGDGWLQWIEVPNGPDKHRMRDLSLAHHVPASPRKESHAHGCQFDGDVEFRKDNGLVSDLGLTHFCGADGLMHLLELLAEEGSSQPDVLEMIKRIHIPGYERARLHAKEAISEGVFEPNYPLGYYSQSDIQAILKWAEEQEAG